MGDIIDRLIKFVNIEQDEQNTQVEKIWSLPLRQRVHDGEAIEQVEISKNYLTQLIVQTSQNISKFRAGSKVVLHKGDPSSGLSCDVLRDAGRVLLLAAGFNTHFKGVSGKGWIIDRDRVDVRHILINALESVRHDESCRSRLSAIFDRNEKSMLYTNRAAKAKTICSSLELNSSQQKAFIGAFACSNYFLIQGPPGTGKTWLLAHLAHSFAKEGQRVLITAFTHRAINNALFKIASVANYEKVMKVGQETYANGLTSGNIRVRNYEYFAESPYTNTEVGLIVGGTCYAARTRRLAGVEFDTIIFDEASQVTLPIAIAGMLSGKKFIFIGDHKQMPPIIVADHVDKQLTKSAFEYLFDKEPGIMLNVTYRMNQRICEFPSRQFYSGKLVPDNTCINRQLKIIPQNTRLKQVFEKEQPDIFIQLDHLNSQMRSKAEADLVFEIVVEALDSGLPPNEIAVIAPFRAQGRLIRALLGKKYGYQSEIYENIIVDTVERIQGQEKELVLISLTTSDLVYASQNAKFYFHPNRLNVALTRAKSKRIVIGNKQIFATKVESEEINKWIAIFGKFYESATKCYLTGDDIVLS